jgi:phosphoglycolate phosphatase-like HAD superfamily hydrolase
MPQRLILWLGNRIFCIIKRHRERIVINRESNYLALDFDGVIADSIGECLVVAHNAFVEFGGGPPVLKLSEIDPDHVAESRRLRNFIRYGEDYVYISLAIHKGTPIHNQDDFDTFTDEHESLRQDFLTGFYRERERFLDQHRSGWLELNPLYEGLEDFLLHYQPRDHLFIITTKRINFVQEILLAHGIQLRGANLFHAHGARSKRTIISELLGEKTIPLERFHFIDDQVDTLLKVVDTGIHTYLAEWGYNNPDQVRRAAGTAINVLSRERFLEAF